MGTPTVAWLLGLKQELWRRSREFWRGFECPDVRCARDVERGCLKALSKDLPWRL